MRKYLIVALVIQFSGCARSPLSLRSLSGHAAPMPSYPPILVSSGIEGESVVQIVWLRDGTVDITKTHGIRESHRGLAEAVLVAVRQWSVSPHHADSVRVEVQFALTYARCTARDSAQYPASRAKLRADSAGLHILVEAGDCRPYRPPVAVQVPDHGPMVRASVHDREHR
jgi:TonB family protein